MKKEPTTKKRKPAAMVRISPKIHRAMKAHITAAGLVQARFVDSAILAALPKVRPGKAVKRGKRQPQPTTAE